MKDASTAADLLCADWRSAVFVGRIATVAGPSPILIRDGEVYDVATTAPTVSALLAMPDPAAATGDHLGALDDLLPGLNIL